MPPKHRWSRAIHTTQQRLRDLSLSNSLLMSALRPATAGGSRPRGHASAPSIGPTAAPAPCPKPTQQSHMGRAESSTPHAATESSLPQLGAEVRPASAAARHGSAHHLAMAHPRNPSGGLCAADGGPLRRGGTEMQPQALSRQARAPSLLRPSPLPAPSLPKSPCALFRHLFRVHSASAPANPLRADSRWASHGLAAGRHREQARRWPHLERLAAHAHPRRFARRVRRPG